LSVSFSPDGQHLATAGADGIACVWGLSGHVVAELSHRGKSKSADKRKWSVKCVSFSPDGQYLATAGKDGTTRLWNLSEMSFSPDEERLAMTGQEGTVNLWLVEGAEGLDELLSRGCDWLKDYLAIHPEALEKLEVCQNRFKAVEVGRNLAKSGDVESATLASPASVPFVSNDLSSECEIDYAWLRELLVAGQWQRADWETTAIMLKIAGRKAEDWLRPEDIEKFPCTDLLTIDQLWVKYSKGRFGFSVQKRIWQRVGGTKNADYEIYRSFSKRVGWGNGSNSWLYYSDLTFAITAPVGHLPGGVLSWLWSSYREISQLGLWVESGDGLVLRVWWKIISSLASRLEESNNQL
jgi:WD40 repeat protein